jgi:hypothetical protein
MTAINRHHALAEYIAMGVGPSLAALYRRYAAEIPNGPPPAEITLKKWSQRYGWAAAARRHDENVGRRLLEQLEGEAVNRGFDRVQALLGAAQACLDDAAKIRLSGVGTAQDKKALISAAIDALKMVQVLTGGVSERQERVGGMAQEARDLLRALEARARQRGLAAKVIEGEVVPVEL